MISVALIESLNRTDHPLSTPFLNVRIFLLSILAGSLPFLAQAESLTLLPAKFTLDGPAAEQRLVLELVAPQPK